MIVHADDDAMLNPNLRNENGDSIVDETETTTDCSVSNSTGDNTRAVQ